MLFCSSMREVCSVIPLVQAVEWMKAAKKENESTLCQAEDGRNGDLHQSVQKGNSD